MSDIQFSHTTVLLEDAVASLKPCKGGVYVDATLGGGGHTRRLLDASTPDGQVIAFDQDESALAYARQWGAPYGSRLTLIHDNFRNMSLVLQNLGTYLVDGILCDLGVSSPQLDEAHRGFSYQQDAMLDMRMDSRQKTTAETLLASLEERELAKIFRDFGEEKWAARIAAFIVRERARQPIATTGHLVDVIKAAIPASARREGPHPAKRVFQALRIAVNDELGALQDFLSQVPGSLHQGGRVGVITFHSLEDRAVKSAFADYAKDCICPPQLPQCVCDHPALLKVISRKAISPSPEELANNPRARSAKLRVAERL